METSFFIVVIHLVSKYNFYLICRVKKLSLSGHWPETHLLFEHRSPKLALFTEFKEFFCMLNHLYKLFSVKTSLMLINDERPVIFWNLTSKLSQFVIIAQHTPYEFLLIISDANSPWQDLSALYECWYQEISSNEIIRYTRPKIINYIQTPVFSRPRMKWIPCIKLKPASVQ